MKRVIICNDPHCGHLVGLTPPDYRITTPGFEKFNTVQGALWDAFATGVKKHGPFDIAIFAGDLVDGKGRRSGGTENFVQDMKIQADMASVMVSTIGANQNYAVYGTPYHVADGEGLDWEDMVEGIDKIESHGFYDINGTILDVKHKVGSSSTPYGRHTAVAKEDVWNLLWSEADGAPRSDIIVRAHVHYYTFCGRFGKLQMTLPALQGKGSKFGARQCSGLVDFGFVVMEFDAKGGYTWFPHIVRVQEQRTKAIRL